MTHMTEKIFWSTRYIPHPSVKAADRFLSPLPLPLHSPSFCPISFPLGSSKAPLHFLSPSLASHHPSLHHDRSPQPAICLPPWLSILSGENPDSLTRPAKPCVTILSPLLPTLGCHSPGYSPCMGHIPLWVPKVVLGVTESHGLKERGVSQG